MFRLVQDENVDDLQKIIDFSIQVIGEEKSLYDLTQVFLQQGRRAQAKKMLETPGLMYNHKSMTNIMETFVTNKELDCLEDLVRLTKNLFGCDRDYMYLTWVKAVSKNAQKVNDIWLQIQVSLLNLKRFNFYEKKIYFVIHRIFKFQKYLIFCPKFRFWNSVLTG